MDKNAINCQRYESKVGIIIVSLARIPVTGGSMKEIPIFPKCVFRWMKRMVFYGYLQGSCKYSVPKLLIVLCITTTSLIFFSVNESIVSVNKTFSNGLNFINSFQKQHHTELVIAVNIKFITLTSHSDQKYQKSMKLEN